MLVCASKMAVRCCLIARPSPCAPSDSGSPLVLSCWMGCCLIPCCMDECMDKEHSCPNCKAFLGKYRR